jgi:hypothetical protein
MAKRSRVFHFEDIREAHHVMESNEANGASDVFTALI